MRLQVALLSGVLTVFLFSAATAHAQFNEAVSAFKSVVRDANRALNPQRRKRYGLRSTLPVDRAPPPLPVANPNRRRGTVQNRLAKGQGKSTARASGKSAVTARKTNVSKDKVVPAPPPPDVWSQKEIQHARKQCRAILRKVNAKFAPADPIKKGPCGHAAPYRLASIGTKHKVVFKPAPVLNCRMIEALDIWLRKGLQPLAKRHLGGPITQISVMSSYSCRNAYGRKKTRLSEHAKANALDIGGFRTRQGVRAILLADWGPTQRDLIAKAKREEEARIAAAMKAGDAERRRLAKLGQQGRSKKSSPSRTAVSITGSVKPLQDPQVRAITKPQSLQTRIAPANSSEDLPPPLPDRRPSLRQRLQWAKAEQARRAAHRAKTQRGNYKDELNSFLYPRSDLGGPKPKTTRASETKPGKTKRPRLNKAAFLKGAHHTACKIFGTVLGPEANDAHRDHFHVDMAERRYKNYCR